MSALGDVLTFAGVPERIAHPERETFVTIKLNAGGATQRVVGTGKIPVPFTGYRIKAGQFIYSRIDARNGAFAIVPRELDGAVVSKDFPVFAIRRDRVEPAYLQHFFRAGRLQRLVLASSFGATNRQRITEERLLAFPIPLPSLGDQRRIASVLDQADIIRTKRLQILAQFDTLNTSIFREMFAVRDDPAHRLDSLIDDEDRMNYGVVQPGEHVPDGVPLIRISNLVGGCVDRSNMKHISPMIEAGYGRSRIRGNEILVSCVGSIGSVSLVGPADVGSNIARAITRVPISDPVMRTYIAAFLCTPEPRRYFASELRTVAQPTLNVRQLAATAVPIPPVRLQHEFSMRLGHVRAHQAVSRRAFSAIDELFASLQARAFRGEL